MEDRKGKEEKNKQSRGKERVAEPVQKTFLGKSKCKLVTKIT